MDPNKLIYKHEEEVKKLRELLKKEKSKEPFFKTLYEVMRDRYQQMIMIGRLAGNDAYGDAVMNSLSVAYANTVKVTAGDATEGYGNYYTWHFPAHKVVVSGNAKRLNYYDSLEKCGERYEEMAKDLEVLNFVQEFRKGIKEHLPVAKLNRWLCYIQGTLIANGRTTVEEERIWTRPFFKPLDYPDFFRIED
jgi:hypothetical protein